MAPESSSTGTDTSQSSTAAETTSQTSTTEAKSHIPVTAEGAQIMISIIAKEVPFVSDEQRRIIHEEIGGILSLDLIEHYYLRYRDTHCTGSYTPVAFRERVKKLLELLTSTVLDESGTIIVLDY